MTGDRIRRPYDTRRGGQDARAAAEKAFKAVTTKPVAGPAPVAPKTPAQGLPPVREQVTLRIDQDVLERFRESGPGWQDRINAALRKALEP
ncbi:BrnA antitoxin family protein [Rhodoplanes sp. TEM]|uniref:BrnA antitoxin family protein n=1 Tax=Rhodoplanes tepidamans TaxID=200616 RepID=A0ABT5J8U0_RHOTP|nr:MULTISPECIES: BrnA antitoxin family protein [Rhodoplanes]MDC7786076.1 BrnA antitoxin family protein [Rhodoplanes tepidamans]MDC7983783.1 BrnA antitoxin family protein [Rhodoplanes sp. TEM]